MPLLVSNRNFTPGGVQGKDPPQCRCCGSRSTGYRGSKPGDFIRQSFDYYFCNDCDFLFVDPFPGYEIYNDAYYKGEGPDPYVDYESEYRNFSETLRVVELQDLYRVAQRFLHGNSQAKTISWLDFGCGAGGLLKFLDRKRVIQTASGPAAIKLAGHDVGSYAERLKAEGLPIYNLEELAAVPDRSYDVISLIEVIEHVEFPQLVMAEAARLLKPGGLLLLTTGNMASPVARRKGLDYGYMIPEIHISLFTPRCLEILYRRNGLEPHRVRYDGVVRFKTLKTLRFGLKQALAKVGLRSWALVRVIDKLYGVSAMPCARRPI